jgi:hypothetical protein
MNRKLKFIDFLNNGSSYKKIVHDKIISLRSATFICCRFWYRTHLTKHKEKYYLKHSIQRPSRPWLCQLAVLSHPYLRTHGPNHSRSFAHIMGCCQQLPEFSRLTIRRIQMLVDGSPFWKGAAASRWEWESRPFSHWGDPTAIRSRRKITLQSTAGRTFSS